jgi:hypothetical protein
MPVFLQQAKQLIEIVTKGEVLAPLDEDGLDDFLSGLLGLEAEILQISVWDDVSRQRQMALGPADPFAGIVRRQSLARHR